VTQKAAQAENDNLLEIGKIGDEESKFNINQQQNDPVFDKNES
jgi:hypothetical protein